MPDEVGCGFSTQAIGKLRHAGKAFEIACITPLAGDRRVGVFMPHGQLRYLVDTAGWQIDGDPPAIAVNTNGAIVDEPYTAIIEDAQVVSTNLHRSFSGLCLAGRVAGKSESLAVLSSMRFLTGTGQYSLQELITIHDSVERISRVSFFNTRTSSFDRFTFRPSMVVADGAASFLRIVDRPEFQQTNVIGVVHQVMDRDELEALGAQMAQKRQWYEEDSELMSQLPPVRGIGLLALRKRS